MESSGLRGLPADAAALHTPFLDRIFWRRSPCHGHAIVPPRPHGLDRSRPRPPGDGAASPAPPEPRSPGRRGAGCGGGASRFLGSGGREPPSSGPPAAPAPSGCSWVGPRAGSLGPLVPARLLAPRKPKCPDAQLAGRSSVRNRVLPRCGGGRGGERLRIAGRRARPAVPPALTSPPLMRPRRPRTLGLLLSWKSNPLEDEGRDCAGVSISQGSPRWPAYPQKLWEEDLSLTAIRRNHSC
eukprot:XP_022260810.1 uncharacterized protein LOC102153599 [Canis lupus familiaris]